MKKNETKVRVLVVDDSAYNRRVLSKILSAHETIEVVGTAYDGQMAIKKVLALDPDVITLDLEMPVMDGFTFLRWLMANHPKPVIVVSAHEGDENVLRALDMGAFDFLAKPGKISPRLVELREPLIRKVLAAHHSNLDRLCRVAEPVIHQPSVEVKAWKPILCSRLAIAVGASTGGPQAVRYLLEELEGLAIPIFVVQHMPPIFTKIFADRLNRQIENRVKEGEDKEMVEPGTVYIAPGGFHMEVELNRGRRRIRIKERQRGDRYVPSVDRLFRSLARAYGSQLLGVVLTGMGEDGRRGATEVKRRGGVVYIESTETAVVDGMPRAVREKVKVDGEYRLEVLPRAILSWAQSKLT